MYDCTRILVAPDVQDAIIQAYQTKWPEAPMAAIIIRLAISGPKVRDGFEKERRAFEKISTGSRKG